LRYLPCSGLLAVGIFRRPHGVIPVKAVATMVELIGNKWKLLIIRNLLVREYRFGELRKGVPEISQKVLTDNLITSLFLFFLFF